MHNDVTGGEVSAGSDAGTVPRPPHDATRRLLVLAVVCAAAVPLTYLLLVRTGVGQEVDDLALSGRTIADAELDAAAEILQTISVASLALFGIAIMAIAVLRRRWRLAAAAGAVILASNVTTEILKKVVLERPALDDVLVLGDGLNSLPSGHTTVAMSLAVSLVLVVPQRYRTLAAMTGGVYAALVGTATVTSGWHRPSDVIAAYFVATAYASLAAALLVLWRGTGDGQEQRAEPRAAVRILGMAGLGLVALAFMSAVGVAITGRWDDLDTTAAGRDFLLSAAAIVGTGLLLLALLVWSLRRVTLDPPRSETPAARDEAVTAGT